MAFDRGIKSHLPTLTKTLSNMKSILSRYLVHVKWSNQNDGILEIWKDGEKVVDQKGPNTFNDAKGPYFRMGIYKGWKDPDRASDAISNTTFSVTRQLGL